MKTRRFERHSANLILAGFALSCVTFCSAQTQATPSVARAGGVKALAKAPGHAVASSREKQTEEQLPSKGVNTAIKVHGHWLIDVKNPDGSLAQHREFENSLEDLTTIQGLISGENVAGGWDVNILDGTPTDTICGATHPLNCLILQTGVTYGQGGPFSGNCTPAAGISCNLNLTYGNAPTGSYALILSGSVAVTGSGQITGVSTNLYSCSAGLPTTGAVAPSTVSPAQCATNASGANQLSHGAFTAATLANPITNVQPGQTIAVVVYLSFQ